MLSSHDFSRPVLFQNPLGQEVLLCLSLGRHKGCINGILMWIFTCDASIWGLSPKPQDKVYAPLPVCMFNTCSDLKQFQKKRRWQLVGLSDKGHGQLWYFRTKWRSTTSGPDRKQSSLWYPSPSLAFRYLSRLQRNEVLVRLTVLLDTSRNSLGM